MKSGRAVIDFEAAVAEILAKVTKLEEKVDAALGAREWQGATWISTDEASRRLGVTKAALAVWRCSGQYGLRYTKAGRRCMYRSEDVERLLLSRERVSTSDAKQEE